MDFRVGNEYRPLGAEIHCDIHQSELRPHSNALIAVCNPSFGIRSKQELIYGGRLGRLHPTPDVENIPKNMLQCSSRERSHQHMVPGEQHNQSTEYKNCPVDFRTGNEYQPLKAEIHLSELRPHSNALIAVCNPSLGIGSEQELI